MALPVSDGGYFNYLLSQDKAEYIDAVDSHRHHRPCAADLLGLPPPRTTRARTCFHERRGWYLYHSSETRAPLRLHQGDSTQRTLRNQASCLLMSGVMSQVESYTQMHTMRSTCPYHLHCFVNTRGHGLLNEYVFPRLRRDLRVGRVEKVRRGDKHRVYLGVGHEGLQRRVGHLRPVFARKCFSPLLLPAVYGDESGALRQPDGRGDEGVGMFSGADQGPPESHGITSSCVIPIYIS